MSCPVLTAIKGNGGCSLPLLAGSDGIAAMRQMKVKTRGSEETSGATFSSEEVAEGCVAYCDG